VHVLIKLQGKISMKNLAGRLNVVPTTLAGLFQTKRVEPTYEEQVIVADDDYDALSKVIVGPKDRPLMEQFATDEIANHVLLSVEFSRAGMAGLWTPRKYYYGDMAFQEMPLQLQVFPYIAIKEYHGYYQVVGCSKKLWVNPSKLADTLVLDQSAGSLTYATYDQTTNAWGTVKSGNFYSEFDEIVWANYDIPNGSETATQIYFAGSDPVLVEE
jgi:hypothetical protein